MSIATRRLMAPRITFLWRIIAGRSKSSALEESNTPFLQNKSSLRAWRLYVDHVYPRAARIDEIGIGGTDKQIDIRESRMTPLSACGVLDKQKSDCKAACPGISTICQASPGRFLRARLASRDHCLINAIAQHRLERRRSLQPSPPSEATEFLHGRRSSRCSFGQTLNTVRDMLSAVFFAKPQSTSSQLQSSAIQ